jgi:hypothetical protein
MKTVITSFLLVAIVSSTQAQIKSLDNDSLRKTDLTPSEVSIENKREAIIYNVPTQDLQLDYQSQPAKPLSFQPNAKSNHQYLRVGVGSLAQIQIAGSAQLPLAKNTLDLMAGFSRAKGSALQQHQHGMIDAQLHSKSNQWKSNYGINFIAQAQNKYGNYDKADSIANTNFSAAQNFWAMQANASWQPIVSTLKKTYITPSLQAYNLQTNNGINEKNIIGNVMLEHKVNAKNSFIASAKAIGNLLSDADTSISLSNVQPNIGYKHSTENTQWSIGAKGIFGHRFTAYLPYVELVTKGKESKLILSLGANGDVLQPNFESIITQNPFASYNVSKIELGSLYKTYIGLSIPVKLNFTMHGQINYLMYSNTNDYVTYQISLNEYYTDHSLKSANAIQYQASCLYKNTDNFQIGADASLIQFDNIVIQYLPTKVFNAYFALNINAKTNWKTSFQHQSGMYTFTDLTGVYRPHSPVNDLHTDLHYQFYKKLGAYLQWNNILNRANERWFRYQSYASNVVIGLQWKN